ncbi:MAG: hypothetical protein GKR89_23250 [Candidatus Latescibacteria bacterium]|nr:hypothetical protein [Candidatus Latescibacterota bacterium]
MPLSQAKIDQYHRDGQISVPDLLTSDQLDTLRQRIEDIAENRLDFPEDCLEYEPGVEQRRSLLTLRKINGPADHDPFFVEHAAAPALLETVQALLGPDIKLFGDQIFMKPPGGLEKTYHQDSPYFKIEPMALVTAWVALDEVTLDNGCLWVVPGSHKNGPLEHSEPWMVGDRQDMKIPDNAFQRHREIPITLPAGGVSFHHSLLLHRSGPNKTPHHRRGMATHYMSSQSRWTGEPADKPKYPLLTGQEFADCV